MSAMHQPALPPVALFGVVALVGTVLAVTSAVPLGLLSPPQTAQSQRLGAGVKPVVTHALRFLDRADGAVIVEDASRTRPDIVIAPKSNQGFIRGVMRGLARDRKLRGLTASPPFELTLWQDGHLSLRDTATDRTIELDSFGPDNRAAFARLLAPQPAAAAQ